MISKEDIKNLANLARIEVTDAEAESMTGEMDAILGYVGQISEASGNIELQIPPLRNVMREDVVTHEDRQYTEKLLKNAPQREGEYLKVKKIL